MPTENKINSSPRSQSSPAAVAVSAATPLSTLPGAASM